MLVLVPTTKLPGKLKNVLARMKTVATYTEAKMSFFLLNISYIIHFLTALLQTELTKTGIFSTNI